MDILNLTPHPVNILDEDNNVLLTIEPEQDVEPIRLEQSDRIVDEVLVAGICVPVTETVFGEATNLPDEQTGTLLIVSSLVRTALLDRTDLVTPNQVVRNDEGHIVGCRSFARN